MRLRRPFGLFSAIVCIVYLSITGVSISCAASLSSDSLAQGSDGADLLVSGFEADYVTSTPLRPLVNDTVAGDMSGDSFVDESDIQVISDHWLEMGPPSPMGDANVDDIVDIFDVNFVSANWNPKPIPEPSSLLLLGLTLPALWWIRHATRRGSLD